MTQINYPPELELSWPDPLSRKRCARCLYPFDTPAITFNDSGVCNYCEMHDQFATEYPTGEEGQKKLEALAEKIRREGKNKRIEEGVFR